MSLTEDEAYDILQLNPNVSKDEIRSAYKRLALEWHPDKHDVDREEATRKFQEISAAYKRLTEPESVGIGVHEMSMEEMFELFSQIFCRQRRQGTRTFFARPNTYRSYYFSDDDDDDDDASDDDEDTVPANFVGYVEYRKKKRLQREFKYGHKAPGPVSEKDIEEAEKQFRELLKEEEDEKQKAEKKKAKNRKKKEASKKRKKEKRAEDQKGVPMSEEGKSVEDEETVELKDKAVNGDDVGDESGAEDVPVWDTTSAFVDRVAQKTGVQSSIPQPDLTSFIKMPKPREHLPVGVKPKQQLKQAKATVTTSASASASASALTVKGDQQNENSHPLLLKSQQIASRGNELARLHHYNAAVDLFTEAIRLYRDDHRYYANRSFCYDHLQQYDRALKDAVTCIKLSPTWAKGYFRKGRALIGLLQFSDAEIAFQEVLKLDKQCVDAEHELVRIRVQQLVDMGFSNKQSEVAIKKHGNVQQALDSLLSGQITLVQSDRTTPQANGAGPNAVTDQMSTLWIGNLNTSKVTKEDLSNLFSQYGGVMSVRILLERRCGFVTFDSPATAATAKDTLNGHPLGGKKLVLRYPHHAAPRYERQKQRRGGMP
jgi:curved DNA-binding protein CbpA